ALGPSSLMLAASIVLVVCVGLFSIVHRRMLHVSALRPRAAADPVAEGAGITDLLKSKYLLLLGALMLLLNCVNSNGEYLLDRTLLETLKADGLDHKAAVKFIGG